MAKNWVTFWIWLIDITLLNYSMVALLVILINLIGINILITVLIHLIIKLWFTSTLTDRILSIMTWLKRILLNSFLFILQNSKICAVFSLGLNLCLRSIDYLIMDTNNLNIIIYKMLIILIFSVVLVRWVIGCNSIDVQVFVFTLCRWLECFVVFWILKYIVTM